MKKTDKYLCGVCAALLTAAVCGGVGAEPIPEAAALGWWGCAFETLCPSGLSAEDDGEIILRSRLGEWWSKFFASEAEDEAEILLNKS